MHPRIQAQRESEAAASIDAAVTALTKRYGVEVEDKSVPVRDPALKALFAAELAAERLEGVLKVSRSSDARADEAVARIEQALLRGGVETPVPVRSEDAEGGMRAAWSLGVLADALDLLFPLPVEGEPEPEGKSKKK